MLRFRFTEKKMTCPLKSKGQVIDEMDAEIFYTLNLKCITSPSCTT